MCSERDITDANIDASNRLTGRILEFNSDDAVAYAQVRAKLERAGTPIGSLETPIAAQALARRLVLVSNNDREFRCVAGLHIQNWTKLI
jgi:tRNA(fMet)-specific endonuclease VapC